MFKRWIFFTVLAYKALMTVLVWKKNVFGTAEGRVMSGNKQAKSKLTVEA